MSELRVLTVPLRPGTELFYDEAYATISLGSCPILQPSAPPPQLTPPRSEGTMSPDSATSEQEGP